MSKIEYVQKSLGDSIEHNTQKKHFSSRTSTVALWINPTF